MKSFYTNKGKYKDGRKRVVITYDNGKKNIALPKPEVLMELLNNSKKTTKLQREILEGKTHALTERLVND